MARLFLGKWDGGTKESVFAAAEHLPRVDSSIHAIIKRLISQLDCLERRYAAALAAGRGMRLVIGTTL